MKKLRNKKGFTLTEMLISVMLLGFVSVMVTVMTSAILNSTVTMQEVAQAEILGSEALDNLQWQLRVALNVNFNEEDKSVTFDLDEANKGYTFGIEDGKIILGHKEADGVKGDLLFAGVSYGNLSVKSLKFSKNDAESIKIAVEISYGDNTLWNGSVSVKPLNGVTSS